MWSSLALHDVAGGGRGSGQSRNSSRLYGQARGQESYEPDFVAVGSDGDHHLIETKGLEDIHVAHKDRAAKIWCKNATLLTDVAWSYVKVPQTEFGKLQASDIADVVLAFGGQ
jgi:hypothetical protein